MGNVMFMRKGEVHTAPVVFIAEDTYLLNASDKCTDITGGYFIPYNYNEMRYSLTHANGIQVYPNIDGEAGQIAVQTNSPIDLSRHKKLSAVLTTTGGTAVNTSTVKLVVCTASSGNPINSAIASVDFVWNGLTATAELDLSEIVGECYVAVYWNYPNTTHYGYITTIQLLT